MNFLRFATARNFFQLKINLISSIFKILQIGYFILTNEYIAIN